MTQQYQNSDVLSRVWGNLVDLSTNRTLALGPGEQTTAGVATWSAAPLVNVTQPDGSVVAEPDNSAPREIVPLPADFSDEYLVPVATPVPDPVPAPPTPPPTPETPAQA